MPGESPTAASHRPEKLVGSPPSAQPGGLVAAFPVRHARSVGMSRAVYVRSADTTNAGAPSPLAPSSTQVPT